jgi:hypothetical protein
VPGRDNRDLIHSARLTAHAAHPPA